MEENVKAYKTLKNEDLACFSKIKLQVQRSKDDLGKTLQYFKNHTYSIGNCVANVLNQKLIIENQRHKGVILPKKKVGNNNRPLSRPSFIKTRDHKVRNFQSEKDVYASILREKGTKLDESFKALQPKKRSRTTSIFPYLQGSNYTNTVKNRIKRNKDDKWYKKQESNHKTLFLSNSNLNSSKEKTLSIDKDKGKSGKSFFNVFQNIDTDKRVGKKGLKKIISILNNISGDARIEKNLLTTQTFSTITDSGISEIKERCPKNNFTKKNPFLSRDMSSLIHNKHFHNTLNSFNQTDERVLKKDPKSRTHHDIHDNFRSSNFNNTQSFNKYSFFSTEFLKIKKEESYIREKNEELIEDIIKTNRNRIEIDPFKKEFQKDIKLLDKINVSKSIYIFGNNMSKPQILKEKGENIFIETDKITKISSNTAYNSKDILFERFKIVQNNKNPNLINFRLKTKKVNNSDDPDENGKDKFKIVKILCNKIMKRKKTIFK
jgi:hypothetical protein